MNLKLKAFKTSKWMAVFLLVGLNLSMVSSQVDAVSLIEKHGAAMGGKKAWSELKNYSQKWSRANGAIMQVNCVMPDKIELSFQKDSLFLRKMYDGEHGYIINNGMYQEMRDGESIEMAEEAEYFSELIFALDRNYDLQYLGTEEIEGLKTYKLSVKKNEIDQQIYWLDATSYLIYMTGEYSEDPAHDGIYYKTRLEDYRWVDGLRFPFKQTLIPSNRNPVTSVATEIKINVKDLDVDYFRFTPDNCRNLILYWKDRYKDDRVKAFSFIQETIQFKEDGRQDTSTWYEAIQYPNLFRIDFGEKELKNSNLYRNDSIYVLRAGELKHRAKQIQAFMIVEGALYDSPVDTVLSRLTEMNVDWSVFRETNYNGRPCYVIGADENDYSVNQIWIDKERRSTVRRFEKMNNGSMMEVKFDEFENHDGHEIESWLEFYLDGRLIQTERYNDIKVRSSFDERIFHPSSFMSYYWY